MRFVLKSSQDVLSGSAVDIVRAMQSRAFGVDHLELDAYIDWLVAQTQTRLGVSLNVGGSTIAERSGALLEALVAHDLATVLDRDLSKPT